MSFTVIRGLSHWFALKGAYQAFKYMSNRFVWDVTWFSLDIIESRVTIHALQKGRLNSPGRLAWACASFIYGFGPHLAFFPSFWLVQMTRTVSDIGISGFCIALSLLSKLWTRPYPSSERLISYCFPSWSIRTYSSPSSAPYYRERMPIFFRKAQLRD